jgi:RNA polymerase sigma factor (sigma-70 family)
MQQPRTVSTQGDSQIARLYQQHALSIMIYVHRHVSSREDAEDIVLEVFLAALDQKNLVTLAYLDEQKQLTWLRGVAYHKCIDYQRRAMRRAVVPLEEAGETLFSDERHSPEQLALRHEEDTLLRERLHQLPEHYQTVLQLRFAGGLSCDEIARHINKSNGAVRTLLSRALNILRSIYIQ